MALKVHGLPLSQPFRSVVWPCLIKGLSFTVQLAVPGTKETFKYSLKRQEYASKFPFRTVPSIEDDFHGEKICLAEAPAILAYLASTHGWEDIYPSSILERSKVDEYLHWHHTNIRYLTFGYFRPFMLPNPLITNDVIKVYQKTAERALKILENTYLASSPSGYILGTPNPTAADFMAYEDLCQVSPKFCNLYDYNETYPNITAWLNKMSSLPFHDEVHVSLKELGDLSSSQPQDITKRMGNANKVGLKALSSAINNISLSSKL